MKRYVFLPLVMIVYLPLFCCSQHDKSLDKSALSYAIAYDTNHVNNPFQTKNPGKALGISLFHTLVPVTAGASLIGLTWSGAFDFKYYDEDDIPQNLSADLLLLGGGLMVYGLVIGPSAGLKYAGDYNRAKVGVYSRAATLGAFFVTAFIPSESVSPLIIHGVQILTLGGFMYSAVNSIVSGPKMARRFNAGTGSKTTAEFWPGFDGKTSTPMLSVRFQF